MNSVLKSTLTTDLCDLYNEDFVAQSLLDIFATRKNDVRVTTARRAARLAQATRGEIIAVFKRLAEIGAGEFKMGRRGAPTRMEWNYSVRSLGIAAQGGSAELASIDPLSLDESEADSTENEGQWSDWDSDDGIEHNFQLRPDTRISIRLPKDLNAKEAERLAGFIRQLPFGED